MNFGNELTIWNTQEVCNFLKNINMSQYIALAEKKKLTGYDLCYMTLNDFSSMGISNYHDKSEIIRNVKLALLDQLKFTVDFENKKYNIQLDFDNGFNVETLCYTLQIIFKSKSRLFLIVNDNEILMPNLKIIELILINPKKYRNFKIIREEEIEKYELSNFNTELNQAINKNYNKLNQNYMNSNTINNNHNNYVLNTPNNNNTTINNTINNNNNNCNTINTNNNCTLTKDSYNCKCVGNTLKENLHKKPSLKIDEDVYNKYNENNIPVCISEKNITEATNYLTTNSNINNDYNFSNITEEVFNNKKLPNSNSTANIKNNQINKNYFESQQSPINQNYFSEKNIVLTSENNRVNSRNFERPNKPSCSLGKNIKDIRLKTSCGFKKKFETELTEFIKEKLKENHLTVTCEDDYNKENDCNKLNNLYGYHALSQGRNNSNNNNNNHIHKHNFTDYNSMILKNYRKIDEFKNKKFDQEYDSNIVDGRLLKNSIFKNNRNKRKEDKYESRKMCSVINDSNNSKRDWKAYLKFENLNLGKIPIERKNYSIDMTGKVKLNKDKERNIINKDNAMNNNGNENDNNKNLNNGFLNPGEERLINNYIK